GRWRRFQRKRRRIGRQKIRRRQRPRTTQRRVDRARQFEKLRERSNAGGPRGIAAVRDRYIVRRTSLRRRQIRRRPRDATIELRCTTRAVRSAGGARELQNIQRTEVQVSERDLAELRRTRRP